MNKDLKIKILSLSLNIYNRKKNFIKHLAVSIQNIFKNVLSIIFFFLSKNCLLFLFLKIVNDTIN